VYRVIGGSDNNFIGRFKLCHHFRGRHGVAVP